MSKRKKEIIKLTFLNIFFIVLCFITLIPILYAVTISFSGQNSLLSSDFSFIPKEFTLDNYKEVLFGEDINNVTSSDRSIQNIPLIQHHLQMCSTFCQFG